MQKSHSVVLVPDQFCFTPKKIPDTYIYLFGVRKGKKNTPYLRLQWSASHNFVGNLLTAYKQQRKKEPKLPAIHRKQVNNVNMHSFSDYYFSLKQMQKANEEKTKWNPIKFATSKYSVWWIAKIICTARWCTCGLIFVYFALSSFSFSFRVAFAAFRPRQYWLCKNGNTHMVLRLRKRTWSHFMCCD